MTDKLSYAAGLFDGVGSFSIQVNIRQTKKGRSSVHFVPKITLTLKNNTEVLDDLVELFGGTIYKFKDGSHRWSMGRKDEMLVAAQTLREHLRVKREQCDMFIQALSLFPDSSQGVNKWAGERAWTEEASIRVAEIALKMNSNKSRDVKSEIKTVYHVDAIIVKENNADTNT